MSRSFRKNPFCSYETYNSKIRKVLKRNCQKKIRKMSFEIDDNHLYKKIIAKTDWDGVGYKHYSSCKNFNSEFEFRKYILFK